MKTKQKKCIILTPHTPQYKYVRYTPNMEKLNDQKLKPYFMNTKQVSNNTLCTFCSRYIICMQITYLLKEPLYKPYRVF